MSFINYSLLTKINPIINAIFILLFEEEPSKESKHLVDKIFNISSLLDLQAGELKYSPFNEIETFNCGVLSKEKGRIVFGFRIEENNDILMLLEDICSVSHDFGFMCYYFSDNNGNHLAMYVASNTQRQIWYGQTLTGISIEALYTLRNLDKYRELYIVYELFCSYESHLSDADKQNTALKNEVKTEIKSGNLQPSNLNSVSIIESSIKQIENKLTFIHSN